MSQSHFRIELLPAKQGDAIWIEYGNQERQRRILIDGGPNSAYSALEKKFSQLPEGDKRVELVVITHVDTDHIEGIIRLLAQKPSRWPILPKDIWFNGWRHLKPSTDLGGREGDFLSALIRRRAFEEWNNAFDRKPIVVLPDQPLPEKSLEGGMKLTLLAPTPDQLEVMADKWEEDVDKFGLEPGDLDKAWEELSETTKFHLDDGLLGGEDDFDKKLMKQLKTDQSLANGTSIAFLAQFDGRSCLFLGDAHADAVCDSLEKIIPAGKNRLKVDAFKMSHHGSRSNISKRLMELVDAKHFLVSTNGRHKHPSKYAIKAAINWSVNEPTFWFNYRTKYSTPWSEVPQNSTKSYNSNYPKSKDEGIVIEL